MARPLRLEYPGAVWHVTSRGHNKQDIYFSDDDRALFTSMLADAVRRYGWILHEYTMMTNHRSKGSQLYLPQPHLPSRLGAERTHYDN